MLASAIVLLGPRGVGKSTQAELLARRIAVPLISLDVMAGAVYCTHAEFRRSLSEVPHAKTHDGVCNPHFLGEVLVNAKRRLGLDYFAFEEQLHETCVHFSLDEYETKPCVIEFGAGHACYNSDRLRQSVERRLLRIGNLIQLMPYDDQHRSAEYLFRMDFHRDRASFDRIFHELTISCKLSPVATVVYVAEKTELQIHEEIMALLRDQLT